MADIMYVPIPTEQWEALKINSSTILESFVNEEGYLVIRPLEDTDDYICDGDCEGCPIEDNECDGNCESCPCRCHCDDSECCPCCGAPLNE